MWYLDAVDEAFRSNIDYAMLVKIYGRDESEPETRYSPRKCNGARKSPSSATRTEAHLDQLRGAPEPHDAHVDEAIHPADQCVLKEGREPRAGNRAALHVLQLCQNPPGVTRHTCNGRRRKPQALGVEDVVRLLDQE